MNCKIRKASAQDMARVHELIVELAVYEKEPNAVKAKVEDLIENGFGENPIFRCYVLEENNTIIGMALLYTRYSTWSGKTLYLEDLIVSEKHRGKGYGKMMFDYLIELANKDGYAKLQWQVLDWNTPAIDFYKSYDAEIFDGWLNAQILAKK